MQTSLTNTTEFPLPTIIPRSDHNISRDHISSNALKVLYRLKDAGFRACLVGGGVRDLLLGMQPKDFDVATDATPEEINALFRNCRLIGRRFRLAHIRYGREIIEVATFRGFGDSDDNNDNDTENGTDKDNNDAETMNGDGADDQAIEYEQEQTIESASVTDHVNDDNRGNLIESTIENTVTEQRPRERSRSRKDRQAALNTHETNQDGFVVRDNIYGTIEEDAIRRDLTINALYYDIEDFSVIDYCGGVEDIHNQQIQLIGDPKTRYQEDPVRMLRVIRFANKLGFQIAAETEAAIAPCAHLLRNIPPARLVDEGLKMFMGGQAIRNYQTLAEHDLLKAIIPFTLKAIEQSADLQQQYFTGFIEQGLTNSDNRVAKDLPITPYYMLAVLLWPAIVAAMQPKMAQGETYHDALHAVADDLLSNQQSHIAIPRRYSTPMKEVWLLQSRLERTRGGRADKLITHPRFRAAYDFLLLRGNAGEDIASSMQFWTDKQASMPRTSSRGQSTHHRTDSKPNDKRYRNRNRRPSNTQR